MQHSAMLALAVLAFAAFTLQASATSSSSGRFDVVKTSNGTVFASDLKSWGWKSQASKVDSFINATITKISWKTDATVEVAADGLSFTVIYAQCNNGRNLLNWSGCWRKPVYVSYYGVANGTTVRGTVLVKYWPGKNIKTSGADTATWWKYSFTASVTKTLDQADQTTVDVSVEDVNNATAKTRKGKFPAPVLVNFTDVEALHSWKVEAALVDATTFNVTIEKSFWKIYSTPIAVTATSDEGEEVDGLVFVTIRKPKGTKPGKPGKPGKDDSKP